MRKGGREEDAWRTVESSYSISCTSLRLTWRALRSMRAALEAQLVEEETEARVAAAVEARVSEVMASEAVQATLTARLQAERRVLEEQARACLMLTYRKSPRACRLSGACWRSRRGPARCLRCRDSPDGYGALKTFLHEPPLVCGRPGACATCLTSPAAATQHAHAAAHAASGAPGGHGGWFLRPISFHLQVQRELEEERLLAEQAAREAQAAIEAKQSELQAIEAARLRAVRSYKLCLLQQSAVLQLCLCLVAYIIRNCIDCQNLLSPFLFGRL